MAGVTANNPVGLQGALRDHGKDGLDMPKEQKDTFLVSRVDAERFVDALRVAINVICMDAPLPEDNDYDEDAYEFMDEIHSFRDRLEEFLDGGEQRR